MPHVPVLRAATPVHDADGQPFGILIINVDMRPILAELRSTAEQTARVYVINEQGDYLVNADQSLEFDLAVGQPPRWRSDFPELAGVLQSAESLTHVFHGSLGELLCAATAPLQIAGGPRILVIETVPYSEIMAPAGAVRWSGLLVALGATVCALGVAVLLARSLARPLEQMTKAVERFRGEEALGVALGASGEIGILASAFNSMAAQVRQKNAALQQEIAERRRTERILERRATELERSNAELQQFAYVASHDLQEPLRSIAGYTRLLAKRYQGKLDKEADEFIAFAIAGAERMQELISDLLVYARVGTRGTPPQPADMGVLVHKVIDGMHSALQQWGAEIICEDLPTIHVDQSQLGQLFQNLISNGLKFRAERPPRIHISATQKGADWLFSVADNGIGVEKEFLERIFEMFQRLHERDKYEGSGIGLAIARKVVHRHGGRIWAESELGKGTTFFFTIPVAPLAGETGAQRQMPTQPIG
jgi:signal transduction histidine kinase